MNTYWVSFRIHQDAGYQKTYNALHSALEKLSAAQWWLDTSSFYIIQCDDFSSVVRAVKANIRPQTDLAVVGSFNTKACSVIGDCPDQDIFALVDFAKKA